MRRGDGFTTFAYGLVLLAAVMVLGVLVADEAHGQDVSRGEYLARASDCIACHTDPGREHYAGGRAINTPFGTVYSTNITPDPEHGIGRYSAEDFARVLGRGIATDRRNLYPAMPYPSFTRLTRTDMDDLHAFFMKRVKPVAKANRATKLPWPYRKRSLLKAWNSLYFVPGTFVPDASKLRSWNRGAYLVQGPGHCGACHTPRGFAGQELAGSERDGDRFLAGETLDDWHAPSLGNEAGTGLRDWSREDIAEFLKTGRTHRTAAVGAMAEVVVHSTQYLTDSDRMAIAEYLKSLGSGAKAGDATRLRSDASAATTALRSGDLSRPGARVYLDNCNTCHRSDGSGTSRTFPALAGNELVNAPDPASLIHVVLTGSAMPSTLSAPTAFTMPDFAWRLSDAEIAEVLTFVRASWGNQAPAVRAHDVKKMRGNLAGTLPPRNR